MTRPEREQKRIGVNLLKASQSCEQIYHKNKEEKKNRAKRRIIQILREYETRRLSLGWETDINTLVNERGMAQRGVTGNHC